MKNEILKLLRDKSEYVSGQELCEQFNVSRTAIWKAIEQLKKAGYDIKAVRNKGYLLVDDSDVYNGEELKANISTQYIGRNSFFYDTIGSTNTEAKRLAEVGETEGTLVVADQQIQGKGRRGRSWKSPAGTNIYFTLMLRPDFETSIAPMLTIIMAMAVADGIRKMFPDHENEIKIKWPNDVVINGKKVCGILTEMSVEHDYIQHVVIGTGINVKRQEFEEEIASRATSIDIEFDSVTHRCKLIGFIMEAFEKYYEDFKKTKNLENIKESYEEMLVNKDRQVVVLDPQGEFNGVALGINERGELLVKKEDGEVCVVYAGEVSVRGIYGYV